MIGKDFACISVSLCSQVRELLGFDVNSDHLTLQLVKISDLGVLVGLQTSQAKGLHLHLFPMLFAIDAPLEYQADASTYRLG